MTPWWKEKDTSLSGFNATTMKLEQTVKAIHTRRKL